MKSLHRYFSSLTVVSELILFLGCCKVWSEMGPSAKGSAAAGIPPSPTTMVKETACVSDN